MVTRGTSGNVYASGARNRIGTPLGGMTTATAKIQQPLLSVQDACTYLGIGKTTIYRFIDSGQLRTVKFGRRRLVPVEALDEFIAQGSNA